MIKRVAGVTPIAWFPAALRDIVTHLSGRIWTGSVGNHPYIIQLEGVDS